MKRILFCISITILLLGAMIATIYFLQTPDPKQTNTTTQPLGVWWWDNRIDDSYLDFASENGVTEIYYYVSSFNENIARFIKKANTKQIQVYWLAGKYEWIETPSLLQTRMEEYMAFQSTHDVRFAGVHFDIEPHQHPEFETKRAELLYKFVDLVYWLNSTYKDIYIVYDIPCWLDDEVTYNKTTKPVYAHILDNANSVTLMSYRDSAEEILNFAKDELDYAKQTGKCINLGVETQDVSENIVSFYEEGNAYMQQQLNKLRKQIPASYGIAIHYIESWYTLKQKDFTTM